MEKAPDAERRLAMLRDELSIETDPSRIIRLRRKVALLEMQLRIIDKLDALRRP